MLVGMADPGVGLRERKKRRTRDTIVDAAMRLFEERGFDGTTIADIAAAADIAPRTFFAYFPSKEDVVFSDFEEVITTLRARLDDREPGETAIDALRAFIAGVVAETDFEDEQERCRQRLIAENEALAAHDRFLMGRFEDVFAAAVAADLGSPPDGLRARMVAAAAVAALVKLSDFYDETGPKFGSDDPMAVVDEALTFLRGGLESLRLVPTPPPPPRPAPA